MPEYIWPWPKGTRSSQEFGTNPGGVNPPGGHTGLDAPLPVGTPLRAEADGIVTFEGWADISNNPYWLTDGGGICLAIDFGQGKPASIKGHLVNTFVSNGDRVKQGQVVCESGNTGRWTTGPHCHLEFLPPVYKMDGDPTYGRRNPRDWCTGYFEDLKVPTLLQPHQRETQTKVWERTAPDNSTDLTKVKLWDEDLYFDFKGYVIGADALGDGNRVWFVSLHRGTYYHSSAFKDMDTHDLPNLTPPPTTAPPAPAPTPAPAPVPDYGTTLHGADVSNHQGDINLAALPGDFIAIKATEGVGWADPKLDRNARNAESYQRLFYHFARPDTGNTPEAELAWFLETIAPYLRLGDILVLDHEAGGPEHLGNVGWVNTWLTGAQEQRGGSPILYAGRAALDAAGPKWDPVETRFDLWYPAYPFAGEIKGFNPGMAGARPPVVWNGKHMLIWQYTSNGRLPGYDGPLDLNAAYCTREQLAAHGVTKLAAEPVPGPTPEPVPDPEPTPRPRVLPTPDQPIQALLDAYKEQQ